MSREIPAERIMADCMSIFLRKIEPFPLYFTMGMMAE